MNVRLWLQPQGRLLLHLDPHHPLLHRNHTCNAHPTCAPLLVLVQRVEVRAAGASAPRHPAAPELSAPTWASLPLLLLPKAPELPPAHGGTHGRGVVPLSHRRSGGSSVCRRTTTCTKPAGHQGFCSGHKGFKRRESPTASSALGRRPFGRCVFELQQGEGLGGSLGRPEALLPIVHRLLACSVLNGLLVLPPVFTSLHHLTLPSHLPSLNSGTASGTTMTRTSSPATTTPPHLTPRPRAAPPSGRAAQLLLPPPLWRRWPPLATPPLCHPPLAALPAQSAAGQTPCSRC